MASMASEFNSSQPNVINCWSNLTANIQPGKMAIIVSVLLLLDIGIIVGNYLVILVVFKTNKRGTTNFFISSLAAADLLVGVVVLPFSILNEAFNGWFLGEVLCQIYLAIDVMACTASIYNLVAIALERYIAVVKPMACRYLITPLRAKMTVVAVWALSFAVCFPPMVLYWPKAFIESTTSCQCNPLGNSPLYILFSGSCSFLVPMVVIVFLYVRIYQAARRVVKGKITGFVTTGASTTLRVHYGTQAPKVNQPPRPASSAARLGNRSPDSVSICSKTSKTSRRRTAYSDLNWSQRSSIDSQSSTQSVVLYNNNEVKTSRKNSFRYTKKPNIRRRTSTGPAFCAKAFFEDIPEVSTCISRDDLSTITPKSDFTPVHHSSVESTPALKKRSLPILAKLATRYRSDTNLNEINQLKRSDKNYATSGSVGRLNKAPDHSPCMRRFSRTRTLVQSLSEKIGRKFSKDGLSDPNARLSLELKAAKTVAIVTLCFIASWLGFTVIYFLQALPMCSPEHGNQCVSEQVFSLFFWLGYTNSAVNPLVYAIFNKKFRQGFRDALFCCRTEPNSSMSERRLSIKKSFVRSSNGNVRISNGNFYLPDISSSASSNAVGDV